MICGVWRGNLQCGELEGHLICGETLNLLRGTRVPGWVQVRRGIREMVIREDRWLGMCTLDAPLDPCHHSQKAALYHHEHCTCSPSPFSVSWEQPIEWHHPHFGKPAHLIMYTETAHRHAQRPVSSMTLKLFCKLY